MGSYSIVIQGLKAMQNDKYPNFCSGWGICSNLDSWLKDNRVSTQSRIIIDNELRLLFSLWPEYSGISEYPIQTNKKITPHDQYRIHRESGNQWSKNHPYGRARHRLLEWLIQELEKELANAPQ